MGKIGRRTNWRIRMFRRDKWICYYCGITCNLRDPYRTEYATADHKIPKARGGMTIRENLVTACRGCNEGKDNMTEEEYIKAGKPRRLYVHKNQRKLGQ